MMYKIFQIRYPFDAQILLNHVPLSNRVMLQPEVD